MPACLVKHISIKELEVFPSRRNLNVTVAGYGSAPNLVYICHMDTVTFGMVQGGYQPYVVPDACTTWIDMRLVPPATTAKAETIVQDAIERAQQEVAGIQGTYRITGDRPPIERDPGSPLLAALIKTVEQTTGAPAQLSYFTGYTDTAVIAGTCSNHNCMSYGPGSLALAHKPNECVPRDDIQRVEAVLTDLLLSQSGLA